MRVIAGRARRLNLKTTPGPDTRPTADKIKETLFNILNPYLPGCSFLDLFAGSGAIGIEALSRGASICVFVDCDKRAAACINDNLGFTRLKDGAVVMNADASGAINRLAAEKYRFDIIYLDPPYRAGLEEGTLRILARSGIADPDSMVILEASKATKLDFLENLPYEITRIKDYKNNRHVFLKLTPGGQS